MSGNLVQLMTQLGGAALKLSAKMERLMAGLVVEPDDEVRALTDDLMRTAIGYTARLIVICKLGTPASAKELETKLIAGFGEAHEPSLAFERAAEILASAARTYAYAMAALAENVHAGFDQGEATVRSYEPARQLGNAAIAFTMQLTVAHSRDHDAARETARQLESILVAKVDEAYAAWRPK